MTTPASNPPETRWCVRCGEVKVLDTEHFARLTGRSDFSHHCKDCGMRARSRVVAPAQNGLDWS